MISKVEYCNLKEENRGGYIVPAKMKSVWNIQLEMLQRLIDVCKKHDIKITVSGGSMLGAVRHQGYIPWDDDIDVDMLRPDYDKLLSIAAEEFKAPFFFQTAYSDNGYYRGHAQIRYDNTTAILPSELDVLFNQGIFIDIFVMDGLPSNIEQRASLIQETQQISNFLWMRKYPSRRLNIIKYIRTYQKMGEKAKWDDKKLYSYFESLLRANSINDTTEIAPLAFDPLNSKSYRKKEWYKDVTYMPFENIQVPVSTHYDDILKLQYGPNYMTPLHVNTLHGEVIIDTNRSYKEYIKHKPSLIKMILQKIKTKINR